MSRLTFIELALMSTREQAARRVTFDPNRTVVRGDNDTGKSSLLKSLYWALGAEPAVTDAEWKKLDITASLRFAVDDAEFRMIRTGTRFNLFDARDELVGSFTSVTNELGPEMARLFNFHLTLRDKQGRDVQATPALLFLPFYIDQDRGWSAKLQSFSKLQQFKDPKRDVLEFHMGIRPSDYYQAKSQAAVLEGELTPLRQQREVVDRLLEKANTKLEIGSFNIDLDAFKAEIEQVLARAEELRAQEVTQRSRMSDAYTRLTSVHEQAEIVRAALREHREDRKFAEAIDGESVECPTCHAVYENGFAERFSIAVDEDKCVQLLVQLDEEKRAAQTDYNNACEASNSARQLASEVQDLLASKREAIAMADLIKQESRKETQQLLGDEIAEVSRQIGEIDSEIMAAKAKMKQLDNKERREQILSFFEAEMQRLLNELGVRSSESMRNLAAALKETGSDLPRAILAFFLAVVRTTDKFSSAAICPLVIDSPNQQDQDESNWTNMQQVLAQDTPSDCQLILGVTDLDQNERNWPEIILDRKFELLQKGAYEDVSAELNPLIERALNDGP